jgi:pSer/pThr/pTyr-binding forkhead associated (FHA) protein
VRSPTGAGPAGPRPAPRAFARHQSRITIGRGAGADVRIPHLSVSESHASLRNEASGYHLVDQGSTNGTKVNASPLSPSRKRKLVEGDRIEIGAYTLTFQASLPIARPTTADRTSELARRLFHQWQKKALQGPRLVVLQGPDIGKAYALPEPPARVVIGRAPSCQLVLADDAALPEHCEVSRDLDGVRLRAIDARRSFHVNDREQTERHLRDGDEMMIGATLLLYEEPADEALQALSAEADLRIEAPALAAATPPSDDQADADTGTPPAEATPVSIRPPPRSRAWDADVLVYGLAALVIAASVLGLLALLRE